MKDRLGAELQHLATLDEHSRKVLVGRKHIIEEILSPCRALVAGSSLQVLMPTGALLA